MRNLVFCLVIAMAIGGCTSSSDSNDNLESREGAVVIQMGDIVSDDPVRIQFYSGQMNGDYHVTVSRTRSDAPASEMNHTSVRVAFLKDDICQTRAVAGNDIGNDGLWDVIHHCVYSGDSLIDCCTVHRNVNLSGSFRDLYSDCPVDSYDADDVGKDIKLLSRGVREFEDHYHLLRGQVSS